MVRIENNFRTKYRSLCKKVREEKIRTVRLEPDLFYVARRASGHGRYIVSIEQTKSGTFATCRQTNGHSCPSFGACVHICAAVQSGIRDGRRKLKKESRDEAA